MAFCRNCGAEVNDDVKFCPSCGAATGVSDKTGFDKKAEEFQRKAAELNNTADTTSDFDSDDIVKNKAYAILSYFSVLVLIPLLLAKDSKFARYHANQGLVLFIFEIIGSVIATIVGAISTGLGSICSGLIGLLVFVFIVIGLINAIEGRAKELPVIGNIRILNLD